MKDMFKLKSFNQFVTESTILKEGAMSQLHVVASETETFEEFYAKILKDPSFKKSDLKGKDTKEFLKQLYQDMKANESVDEAFEWWHPIVSLGTAIGLTAATFFAVLGPGWILNPHAIAPGDTWGDVVRHYIQKFKDKRTAKRLTREDVLELINLIQTNIDAPGGLGERAPGVKRYLKGLMNKVEAELNKDEKEVDKDKLLILLRDVQQYAKRSKVDVSDITLPGLTDEAVDEAYTASLGLKKNKWEEINPKQRPDELADEFYNLINIAYAAIGGHSKIQTPADVFSDPEWNTWKVIDVDQDPEADVVIFGQSSKYGTKSSGVGHDGGRDAKRTYLDDKGKSFGKKGFYGEVSSKFAEIMLKKYNVPVVSDEAKVRKVLNKDIIWHGEHPSDPNMPGNGWYSRKLGGHLHTKILVGRPKV